uniref:Zinc finger and BTB domain containing 16b n=1 Tax=Scleropages formosus TaxID=113540 RepID=A0A8C9WSG2_SCLFO
YLMELKTLHNQQYSCFLHQANKLRQLGAFCDTVIVVESQTFRAHSLLLACASKKLENVLSSRQHGQQYHCTLDLLSSRTFQQILDYVYTETLEVSTEDLHGLFKAAQLLEMHQLGEQCRAQLETLNSAPDACQEEAGAAQQAPLDMLQGSPSREEQSDLEVIERSSSPPHHLKNPRPDSTLLVAVPPRVSVIASTAQGALKPTPSRSPRLGWHPIPSSPRMALTSTDFMALRTLHPSEHLVACPFPRNGGTLKLSEGEHSVAVMSVVTRRNEQHVLQRASGFGALPEGEKKKKKKKRKESPGEVPLGCKHCGRYFRDESALRSHRRVHSGEKPYQCERCPKRFSLKHQLDTHHRVHTGTDRASVSSRLHGPCRILLRF